MMALKLWLMRIGLPALLLRLAAAIDPPPAPPERTLSDMIRDVAALRLREGHGVSVGCDSDRQVLVMAGCFEDRAHYDWAKELMDHAREKPLYGDPELSVVAPEADTTPTKHVVAEAALRGGKVSAQKRAVAAKKRVSRKKG